MFHSFFDRLAALSWRRQLLAALCLGLLSALALPPVHAVPVLLVGLPGLLVLASALTRAVLYSALTNATAFGSLAVSQHPGTASMGLLLMLSLFFALTAVMLTLPALLPLFAPNARRS